MPRYFIEVCYKGTQYSGFQVQKNANSIQSEIEKALTIRFRQSLYLTGASRTDAGVHALQNYFHFDTAGELFHSNDNFTEEKNIQQALYSLNSILPDDIVIKRIFKVVDTAHCRFDAISRKYKYYIYGERNPFYKDTAYFYPYPIDFEKLQEAASIILDTENFISFSKRNTQVNNFNCSIHKSEWQKGNDCIIYEVVANRFLRGMVRGLVGTMLKVGTGKISLDEFSQIVENNKSAKADFSVPSRGLYLIEIKYSNL
ncbi:MAG: tRNA pseudouridine(38-40) synthase TruA [Ginsengibacter sp.]